MTSFSIKINTLQTVNTFILVNSSNWNNRQGSCRAFNFTYLAMHTICCFVTYFFKMAYKNNIFRVYAFNLKDLSCAFLFKSTVIYLVPVFQTNNNTFIFLFQAIFSQYPKPSQQILFRRCNDCLKIRRYAHKINIGIGVQVTTACSHLPSACPNIVVNSARF